MKTIYVYYTNDKKLGELEGAFEADGTLIEGWHCDDANWTNDCFAAVLMHFGINVLTEPPKKLLAKMKLALRENLGQ